VHAQKGHISASRQKSDVTIVSADLIFLSFIYRRQKGAKFSLLSETSKQTAPNILPMPTDESAWVTMTVSGNTNIMLRAIPVCASSTVLLSKSDAGSFLA